MAVPLMLPILLMASPALAHVAQEGENNRSALSPIPPMRPTTFATQVGVMAGPFPLSGGLEARLFLPDLPISFGGTFEYQRGLRRGWSGWGQYHWQWGQTEGALLAGISQAWVPATTSWGGGGLTYPWLTAVVGASFEQRLTERSWLVWTPNIAWLISGGFLIQPVETLMMGRPWVEYRYAITPNLLLSLRSSLLPLQLSWLY